MKYFKKLALFLLISVLATGCALLEKDDNGRMEASGTIEANEVVVAAEIAGKVISFSVGEGQFVQSGQEIARIDDTVLQWQVKQAEAAVAAAEARLGETKKGSRLEQIRQAEATAAQVRALVEGARKALLTAQKDYERLKELYEEGAVTERQLEAARAKVYAAQSHLDAVSSQYRAAREQSKLVKAGATKETISALEAGLEQAVAAWKIAKAQLEKAVIKAPADGVVTEKLINEGEFVNPGTPLAVITDLDHLWLEVYIPEAELGKVKIGQAARVSVDAFPGETFKGKVTYISQEAEFTPKNVQTRKERTNMVFRVKVALENAGGKLKPGMPADVVFVE
ncbi:HlyD family secretion protein [Calderihabitans maritimus]|uniref:Secretion protein HlyD family protein n=1 Tax=Calderihabitans maritimus TaxID=1246530 RepID=A0A1Z5HPT8_9FIRM|nr:efflux RND transporter periplasmic adaptor subunit [Calderihabitans maritimus]GAW91377.1 secretion protein HlyD family protein [Calderihabitans maritimus]